MTLNYDASSTTETKHIIDDSSVCTKRVPGFPWGHHGDNLQFSFSFHSPSWLPSSCTQLLQEPCRAQHPGRAQAGAIAGGNQGSTSLPLMGSRKCASHHPPWQGLPRKCFWIFMEFVGNFLLRGICEAEKSCRP